MNKPFKIDKEEIIKRLSNIKGVKAIKILLPEEIYGEYEDTIHVLYQFQEGEEGTVFTKSLELMELLDDLIDDPTMTVNIAVRITDKPWIFYGHDFRYKGHKNIIEVNEDDSR